MPRKNPYWFQSALPRRSDLFQAPRKKRIHCFNPRSRKGATQKACAGRFRFRCFNPRSRKGATTGDRRNRFELSVSIRAPAKERREDLFGQRYWILFQSALPQRSDRNGVDNAHRTTCFNPRSRKGATGWKGFRHASDLSCRFQSALPQRSDQFIWPVQGLVFSFNPRSRKGATAIRPALSVSESVSIRAPAKERH